MLLLALLLLLSPSDIVDLGRKSGGYQPGAPPHAADNTRSLEPAPDAIEGLSLKPGGQGKHSRDRAFVSGMPVQIK